MSLKEQRAVEMVKLLIERQTDEINRLRDEIAQLQTSLTIKNGTIEQLKARNAQLEDRNATLAVQVEARQVPEGWQLVPVEPTKLMLRAYADHAGLWACDAYKALLAAAPQAEQPGGES